MRRILLTYTLLSLLGILGVQAQRPFTPLNAGNRDQYGNQIDPSTRPDNLEDSTHTDIQSLPPKLYMWRLSETLGNRTIMPVDTASLNFQNTNLVDGTYGHYNYLGNLGSPRLSRIFFERRTQDVNIFLDPYSSFFTRPDEFNFTNSNVPYTNLTYYKAGNKVNGEERFKSYFSVNANKRLAFGFNIDYLYGRGYYSNQSTAHFNAGLFASYIGERYQMHALYNNFIMKLNENGGITDDRYVTRPEEMGNTSGSQYIPVHLERSANRNKDFYVYLTQRYRMGFHRDNITVKDKDDLISRMPADSVAPLAKDTIVTEEFVPVTSFIHTIKIERSRHRFRSNENSQDFFPEKYYLYKDHCNDSTTAFSVKNVFGLALLEGFNKYAKAGLTAYLSHKFSRYDLMNVDTLSDMQRIQYTEQEVFLGGELAKRQGRLLHYNVNGEIGLLDKAIGQFRVDATMDLNFNLFKDSVNFYLRGNISNTLPDFYMRHYHSNYYTWDNENMDKEFRTRLEGELNIARWGTNLRAGIENIKNYTYFNASALPQQHDGNLQVLSATLKQDFRLGILHLDNEVTWQKTSNATVLPLPELSLYHNLYILTKLAKKVLTVQLGADVRYFTAYNAPAYAPGIQQFHLQQPEDVVKIGGYPIVNAYANLHLKRTRIFVMMSHVNAGMGNNKYFLAPHYPINERLLKIGVSWNFYD